MAIAAYHADSTGSTRPGALTLPLVLIDGQLRDDVFVDRLFVKGPVERRTAELRVERPSPGFASQTQNDAAKLIGRLVEVLLPTRLIAGHHRSDLIFRGRVESVHRQLSGRSDSIGLIAVDEAEPLLDRDGLNLPSGRRVTLGELIEQLEGDCSIRLDTDLLGPEFLLQPVGLSGRTPAVRRVIEAICQACFAVARRMYDQPGSAPLWYRLQPIHPGRPVRLSLDDLVDPSGALAELRQRYEPARPQRLTASAAGPMVESTFMLLPGWDPAGEGLADSAYARSTSSDFAGVQNVYRYWALNEDGAFSGPPFNQGQPFDLTTLFDQGVAIEAQALRFRPTLSQTPEAMSLGLFIEFSTNSGVDWQVYPGRVEAVLDRAAVYLADDQLPAPFLAAAKTGQARVRVTACLQSPVPMTAVRWVGNGLAGPFESVSIDADDRFQWRRVADSSQFHDQVNAGERPADVRDDRAALAGWLARQALHGRLARGSATTDLAGVHAGLRLGDRLTRVAGQPLAVALGDPAVATDSEPWLAGIEHRFASQTTRLRWVWGYQ
jgi:hypothetical protein